MKNLNVPNAKAMMFETEEVEILRKAEEILLDVHFTYGGENTIMSLETGEIIASGELARARAILDFIAQYRMIEINPQ